MAVNKVEFGKEALIDLTRDTVTQQSLLKGYSAHNKSGELIEGVAVVPTKVSELENDENYIKIGEINDLTPDFDKAETRDNIQSGEKISILFGKVKKWFFDLNLVAFSGNYNDLNNKLSIVNNLLATSSGYVLDATQGKILNDKITEKHNEIVGEFDALGHERYIVKINPGGNAILTFKGAALLNNRNYIIQLSTIYTSTFQYRRYLLRNNAIRIIDNIAPSNITANFNVPELVVIDGTVKVHFEGDKSTSVYSVAVIIDFLG